jgi:hypothetical protein
MSATELYCPDGERLAQLRGTDPPPANAIDWIEVLPSRRALAVHCLAAVGSLDADNVLIEGGGRVSVHVDDAFPATAAAGRLVAGDQAALDAWAATPAERQRTLVVVTDSSGDYSRYALRIVADTDPPVHHSDFDPILHEARFSFKVDCPSDFDCRTRDECVTPETAGPRIDYLAKDYASFRRLMLDRLAQTVPGWRERNPADVGVALVEAIAYAADQISYHQDAAATEAYLTTARLRPSLRRHARLVDYRLGEGRAARAWLTLEIDGVPDGTVVPAGTRVLPAELTLSAGDEQRALEQAAETGGVIFETLHALDLSAARNAIEIHDWLDGRCCLPAGATSATLRGDPAALGLGAGDVLVLERVDAAGAPVSADRQRHAVRIAEPPAPAEDPIDGAKLTEVRWHADDRLPFALTLDDGDGPVAGVIARANVVLAEHGLTVAEGAPLIAPRTRRFRPHLSRPGLTHASPYDDASARGLAAAAVTGTGQGVAVPAVWLESEGARWAAEPDLLATPPFGRRFTVEMEDDGRARLRFGDGVNGRRPGPGQAFDAHYRVGNGTARNIGADKLTALVPAIEGVAVRNPLAAGGGEAPEPLERARLDAPEAFRVQQRAVTEADYAEVARRHPEVARAVATRRWTGSWHTMFVTIDRVGGAPVDAGFEARIRAHLERFRMAGYDLEVDGPKFVPLDLALHVCVAEGYVASDVELVLLDTLSARHLPDGALGFFHPDRLTFGEPVYLSAVVAHAMAVDGVESVRTTRFQRLRELPAGELEAGLIAMGRLEIARLDNDPSAPEMGRLELNVGGGS